MKKFFFFFLLLPFSNIAFSQVDLSNGLVAYYPFNGDANDASGNGNNPVFNNAVLTSDRSGNPNSAYYFNGVDNYIQIPNASSINPANQISLCVLVKPLGFYYGTCHGNSVLMKGDADYQPGNYLIRFDDNAYSFHDNCNTSIDTIHQNFFAVNAQTPSPGYTPYINKDQWYCVVYTYDGTFGKFYIDGVLTYSESAPGLSFTNPYDLFLGKLNNPTFPYWFNGVMDEVRIYNRAINDQEVNALCTATVDSCSNWLATTSTSSYVTVGDVDITGNKLTVEAKFNRSSAFDNTISFGKLVSKHTDGTNINYSLLPVQCEITTDVTGLVTTPQPCLPNLDKTYHVAMVYDGASLKFYRNGFLLTETPCTGNLVNNDLLTTIGQIAGNGYPDLTQFKGYINEVRIWNVARSQTELRSTMNTSLPSPATQPGLVAYYTFDDLLNKQGNPAYNGTLMGPATINATNPNCSFVADSCDVVCSNIDSVRINYNETTCRSFDFNGIAFVKTLPISSWLWDFGDGSSDNIQNTKHVYATSGTFSIKLIVTDMNGCMDSITVPLSTSTIKTTKGNDTIICKGSKAQLFATGGSIYSWSPAPGLNNPNIANPFATPNVTTTYFVKITNAQGCSNIDSIKVFVNNPPVITKSNDTAICKNTGIQLFATGGSSYLWSPASGLNNPNISTPIATPINTTTYYVSVKNSFGCSNNDSVKISVNSIPVITRSNDTAVCEGSLVQLFASGGVSYSWLPSSTLNNPNISNPVATPVNSTTYFVTAKNVSGCANTDSVKIFTKPLPVISTSNDTSVCDNIAVQLFASGGSTYVWSPARTLNNPSINNPIATPLSTTTYKVIITTSGGCSKKDSVKIVTSPLPVISKTNDTSICSNTSLQLFASGGSTYLWTPSSGLSNQNINNPIAKPVTTTTYFIKVSNNPGCFKKDSVKVAIYPKAIITITNDTLVCSNANTQLLAGGGNLYKWAPAATLSNSNIPNPIATPLSTTTYFVNITDINSCSYKDSVKLSVKTPVVFAISADDSICSKSSAQLIASGGDSYLWQPANFISDQSIFNPIASPDVTTVYSVKIKDKTCKDSATLSTQITVLSLPVINATKSNDIDCSSGFSQLNASGAINYLWTPASFLNKNNIGNPVATPTSNTLFTVTGIDNFGCQNTDTITVIAKFTDPSLYLMPNSFTPNGDGLNDCFGPKYWGTIQELDFNIYNRFGEKVFHTENSSACWDGKYKGKLQDVNVFVYTIKAKTVCGTVTKKGVFTLLK